MAFFVACDDRNPNYNNFDITPNLTLPVTTNSVVSFLDVGTNVWTPKTLQQIMTDVKAISGKNFNGYFLIRGSGSGEYSSYIILPINIGLIDGAAYLATSPNLNYYNWKGIAGVYDRNSITSLRDYYYRNGQLIEDPYVSYSISRIVGGDGKYYAYQSPQIKRNPDISFPVIVGIEADTCYINNEPVATDIIGTGGGATHIAKVTGALSALSSNLSDVLIVAGGGGGGLVADGTPTTGANAGGISGSGNNSANQSTGYAFGQGEASGGGGGLYGGYKAANGDSGGAGSGYIGNALLDAKKMVGYNVPTSDTASTKTESVNVYSAAAEEDKPKAGNGFAKITWLRDLT